MLIKFKNDILENKRERNILKFHSSKTINTPISLNDQSILK